MSTDGFSLWTREVFDGFNFALVSEFTEKKVKQLTSNAIVLLSEQKIRAVVTNAKQMQKVQESVFLQLFNCIGIESFCWVYLWWTRTQYVILRVALVIRLNANMLLFFSYLFFVSRKGGSGLTNLATLKVLSIFPMHIKNRDQLTSTALKQPFPVHKQREIPRAMRRPRFVHGPHLVPFENLNNVTHGLLLYMICSSPWFDQISYV